MAGSSVCQQGALEVERVPCLSDNYAWIVHDPVSSTTGVVDTPEVPQRHPLSVKYGICPRWRM